MPEITLEANPGNGGRPDTSRPIGGWRQPALHRRPEPVGAILERSGGSTARRKSARRWRQRAGGLHEPQPRPHVRPARQTLAQASRDLAEALALQPEHLSYYQLTLEPNTAFHRAHRAPGEDLIADMHQQGAHAGRGGIRAVRGIRLCAGGTPLPAQPELLGVRGLPRHRRRRSRQADRPGGTGRAPLEACATRRPTWTRATPGSSSPGGDRLAAGPDAGVRHERPAAAGGFRARCSSAHRAPFARIASAWTKACAAGLLFREADRSDPPSSDRDSSTTSCSSSTIGLKEGTSYLNLSPACAMVSLPGFPLRIWPDTGQEGSP